MKTFGLDDEQLAKFKTWLTEQASKATAPRTAIGGAFTYSFTPTSLGVVATVTNAITNETIDLTDYESW